MFLYRAFRIPILLVFFLLLGLLTGLTGGRSNPIQAQETSGDVRVAILYSTAAGDAQSYAALLNQNGFAAQTFAVAQPDLPQPPQQNPLYLPLVTGGNSGSQAAALQAVPDFSQFDLIIIAPDTGAGDKWSPEAGLVEAIQTSGLPVVGLGAGGHAFFGKLGLSIGHPGGVNVSTASVQVADFGDSQGYYVNPNTIPIPGDEILQIFNAEQSGIAIPLSERLPEGVRVASTSAGQYAIVKEGQRYLLWGFGAAPADMTDTGRAFFVNSLRQQVQSLTVSLRGRTFTPSAGIEQALLDKLQTVDSLHALVQLDRLPTTEEEKALADAGLTLLNYLNGTTYTARVDKGLNAQNAAVADLVRWAGLLQTEDKVDPKIVAGVFEEWAVEGDNVKLLVLFFEDVPDEAAEAVLAKYTPLSVTPHAEKTWAIVLNKSQILSLAAEDAVRWIEEGPAPMRIINDVTRADLNVDAVQNPTVSAGSIFYNGLDGSGVNVAIFDTGINTPTFSHPDFAGRLLRTQNDTNGHGSHVAGIVGASGAQSVANCPYGGGCTDFQMRGMAPNVGLAPYSGWNAGTMDDAVNNLGVEVSNHSYVMACGVYDSTAQGVDNLVRGDLTSGGTAIPAHTMVWAAANQGTGAQWCTTGTLPGGGADPTTGPRGYFSVLSTAKNQIVVGAMNPNSNFALRPSSSRGPTWDGRLKPDVMGVGCQQSTDNDSPGYRSSCGTSMASPSVAGIVALMTEQYHNTFGGRAVPSTLKAILIQTARDLVHHPGQAGFTEYTWNDPDTGQPVIFHEGPDWSTGYGAVDAQAAVASVRAGNFVEGTVSPADMIEEYTFNLPAGRTDIKFTLAWDDEVGDPTLAITAAQLVNDLDLEVVDPNGILWRPWVLPALPQSNNLAGGAADPIVRNTHVLPAFRGVDTLNNVEQVSVNNPAGLPAGNWTIRVRASALPNNNTQAFSLAGDFRTLNIVEPQTGNVAEAGDPNNPNVILVVVEAVNAVTGLPGASTLQDAEAGDFTVSIDGTPATILNGLAVGDQFWLNVRPQSGVYAGGSKYDLAVEWTGFGNDQETRSVLFTEREVTDRAIVVDYSGSMSDYDKMGAAKNAARLFVDQSLVGDRISVVGFSTGTVTPYPLAEVSADPGQPELSAAKTAVNSFTPFDLTAIGLGLLAGQTEVTKAPADFSVADVIVLLSDGMENVDPLYDTPAVKGVIEPTDTIVHTVAVGPSSAGMHALLADIADDNGGESYVVNETGGAMAANAAAVGATVTGIDAWPTTLPNRLGDTYKAIAEELLGESRLFQARGLAEKQGAERWEIEVPEGLSRLTFAVNWTNAGQPIRLRVEDPDGQVYEYDQKNPWCRTDATHETCIIDEKVVPGKWLLSIHFLEGGVGNEFMVWASAKHPVSFQLFVGTPARERVVQRPIQLVAFLNQGEKPLADQDVMVKIFGPGEGDFAGNSWTLQLFDDGNHGDGVAKDGIYGASFTGGMQEGSYAVRGRAKGTGVDGQPFELLRHTSFHLLPKALYIHDGDIAKGNEVKDLLQDNGIGVDLAPMDSVPAIDLSHYNLVIVGPETGYLDKWGSDAIVRHIISSEIPVLGLGEGGYAFFGKNKLAIGWPNGAHGKGNTILYGLSGDSIWDYPYEGILKEKLLQLYKEESPGVDILLGSQNNVQVFGYKNGDDRYGNLVMESNWWMLWGFNDGPSRMTPIGQRLFVNTAHRTLR